MPGKGSLIAIVVTAGLIGGVGGWAWERAELGDVSELLEAVEEARKQATISLNEATRETTQVERALKRARAKIRAQAVRLEELEAAAVAAAAGSDTLADGSYFAYISSLTEETIVIDVAEFLTGEEANEAARADGVIGEGETVPNDYYVRNVNPKLRSLRMADDVRIILQTWSKKSIPEDKEVDLATLVRIFAGPKPWESNVVANGYHLTIQDNRVIEMQEQYVP